MKCFRSNRMNNHFKMAITHREIRHPRLPEPSWNIEIFLYISWQKSETLQSSGFSLSPLQAARTIPFPMPPRQKDGDNIGPSPGHTPQCRGCSSCHKAQCPFYNKAKLITWSLSNQSTYKKWKKRQISNENWLGGQRVEKYSGNCWKWSIAKEIKITNDSSAI